MKCPECDGPDTVVVDSRPNAEDTRVRRRRRCLICSHRFTTLEAEAGEARATAYGNALVQGIAEGLVELSARDLELVKRIVGRLTNEDADAIAADVAAYNAFQHRSAA